MSKLPFFRYDQLFSGPIKLLVRESHEIFINIPRGTVELNRQEVIGISRRYRSIVHECVENLTIDPSCDHSDQIKTFKELEVIWNLCEILLLDVSQAGTLIIQLKNWIKMHFDEMEPRAREVLKSLEAGNYQFNGGSEEEFYWSLVTKLLLHCEHKKAVQLLRSHHEFSRDNQIQLLANMLDRMPLSNQYIVHEFCNKWSNWSDWCKRERDTGQFDSKPAMLNIARLLSQDLEVYEQLAPFCGYWYQLMVAHLFYTDPCIRETDLPDLCRRSISIFKRKHHKYSSSTHSSTTTTTTTPDTFDEIIIAAFEYELIQVVARCCAYLDDNWWFVTHFIDLLHSSGQLKIHDIVEPDLLRETFLQDYATTLFDNDHLWTIGIAYLDNCPTNGLQYLETLLSRVPLSVDDHLKANKIINIAKKRGLYGLAKSVCLLMSRSWLAQTPDLERFHLVSSNQSDSAPTDQKKENKHLPPPVNLSNAMYWAIKSNDSAITTFLSDQYLSYYCKTGTFPERSVFENLIRTPLTNERLAFLAKYYEFKQLTEQNFDNDLVEAGNLIRALLASKIYPKFFCQELLEDAKALLDFRPQLVFQANNIMDLMRSVEEVTKEGMIEDDVELRKKLVQNMARALTQCSATQPN